MVHMEGSQSCDFLPVKSREDTTAIAVKMHLSIALPRDTSSFREAGTVNPHFVPNSRGGSHARPMTDLPLIKRDIARTSEVHSQTRSLSVTY